MLSDHVTQVLVMFYNGKAVSMVSLNKNLEWNTIGLTFFVIVTCITTIEYNCRSLHDTKKTLKLQQ